MDDKTWNFIKKNRNLWLLVSLILFQGVPSMLTAFPLLEELAMGILFTFVVLSSAYSQKMSRRSNVFMKALGVPTLMVHWMLTFAEKGFLEANIYLAGIAIFLYLTFFGAAFFRVLRGIISSKKITLNTLFGAMAGYWLLGLTGGLTFISIEVLIPGAFSLPSTHGLNDLMYFAFVTLTTVGYGEITPVDPFARSVAVNLAIIGQLYLTILVAFLVGKFISDSDSLEDEIEEVKKPENPDTYTETDE